MFEILKKFNPFEIKEIKKKTAAFREVAKTTSGKVMIKHLMMTCGLYLKTFNSENPLANAYNEGRRSVILEILSVLNMTDEEVSKLHQQLNNEDL